MFCCIVFSFFFVLASLSRLFYCCLKSQLTALVMSGRTPPTVVGFNPKDTEINDNPRPEIL